MFTSQMYDWNICEKYNFSEVSKIWTETMCLRCQANVSTVRHSVLSCNLSADYHTLSLIPVKK